MFVENACVDGLLYRTPYRNLRRSRRADCIPDIVYSILLAGIGIQVERTIGGSSQTIGGTKAGLTRLELQDDNRVEQTETCSVHLSLCTRTFRLITGTDKVECLKNLLARAWRSF